MKEFINFIYKNSGNKINRLKIFFIFNLFINLTFINTGCGQKNTDSNDLIGMKINSINRSNHTSLSQNSNSSENIFKEQWYLKNTGEYEFSISTPKKGIDLNIPFEKKYTGKGVNVLILDTGIDFSHPDLKENILENSSFFFSPEKDIPEIVSSHILATNENHHGTNVAGIIGAKKNSQTQFQGIAPEAKLASANIISNNLKRREISMTDMYLKTYDLAKSKNIQIVNISISDEENKFSFFYNPQDNIRLTNKINSFQKQNNNGFIIVKSAGNHTCNLSYALKIANKMPEKNKDEFFDLYQNKSTEKILSKLLQYKEIFKAIRAHLSVFSYDNSFVNEIIVASLSASGITSSYSSIGSNLWITGIGGGDSSTLKSDGIFRLAQEEHADAPRLLTTKIFGRKFNPSITEFDENLSSEYSKNSYTTEFQGTSAAAPTVSGIIALLLQANPNLSSRDIKYILAKTANNAKILPDPLPSCIKILAKLNIFHPDFIKPWNTEWIKNKAGFYFHNFYGFGLIDASKAIEIAENYKSTFNDKPSIEYLYKSESLKKLKKISPGESLIHKINSLKNIIIEAVYVIPYIDAPRADSLAIEIQSPEMTNSIILYPGNSFIKLKKNEKKIKNMKYKLNHYKENDNNNLGSYLTNAFYGEKSGGDWSIKITNYDKKENVKLNGWKLKIIGYEE